jgi:cysteine desulfurase
MNWFGKRRIYLDYASAPPIVPEAQYAITEGDSFIGNPGGIHSEGVAAKKALDDARARIAALLGVKAREIIFTSGLTEANNIAIIGRARALERARRSLEGTHWIVSSIEHASVLNCFAEVERCGGNVTHVDPNERGIIEPMLIAQALKPETVFVSVGWANNEIGTLQPLSDIARVIRAHEKKHSSSVMFHTDVGQAPLYLPTGLNSLGIDLASIGGNKLYGPHGVGALFTRASHDLAPVEEGGPQERGLRPGTESVSLAMGFAAAFEAIAADRAEEAERVGALRDLLLKDISTEIPDALINGDTRLMLPHMLNISMPGIQSEYVTLALDHAGIAVSTKSACREGEERSSHVVASLGGEPWRAENTIRFSLGRDTRAADISTTVEALVRIIAEHREKGPPAGK